MFYATIKVRFDTTCKLTENQAKECLETIKVVNGRNTKFKVIEVKISSWEYENKRFEQYRKR